MNIRYRVTLTTDERLQLETMIQRGKVAVRKIKRAQILLAADQGSTDEAIASNVAAGTSTVYRTKLHFVEEGLERALSELPRSGAPRKLDVEDEAKLCAVACSAPPTGRAHWTLQLLADEMVRLTVHKTISSETIRRRLGEMDIKPWQKKMWCIPKVDGEFAARMEDVLALYAEPPDARRPVVCFDETPRQLIGEARVPVRAEPGKRARYDYEYVRNGTANVFMFVDVNRPWRRAKVTDQRTGLDFADCMKDLVDIHYPEAQRIRVVLDNLSTHSAGALYERFPPAEARRILDRLEFHYTPKHASCGPGASGEQRVTGTVGSECASVSCGCYRPHAEEVTHGRTRFFGEFVEKLPATKWLHDRSRPLCTFPSEPAQLGGVSSHPLSCPPRSSPPRRQILRLNRPTVRGLSSKRAGDSARLDWRVSGDAAPVHVA